MTRADRRNCPFHPHAQKHGCNGIQFCCPHHHGRYGHSGDRAGSSHHPYRPVLLPKGTVWTGASGAQLTNTYQPALAPQDLPPIDLILLSHEDHKDNLDNFGRQLLDGRRVITTVDGERKLAPRKGVHGLQPWETTTEDHHDPSC